MVSDKILVEQVRQGDIGAFSQLVTKHQPMLLRVIVRMVKDITLAEDIVQESFMKAYQKIEYFEGRSSFKSWLFQIAINTGKNKLRSRRHEFVEISKVKVAVDPRAEKNIIYQSLKELVKLEIDLLPDKQKMALSLRIFEELSFKEVAEIMNCPYDTAKANYRHGLLKLREKFQDNVALKGIARGEDGSLAASAVVEAEI